MMSPIKFFALIVVGTIIPSSAHAQAFGVKMGAPVSSYGGNRSSTGRIQYTITVPQPNDEFESYTAWATPETGICKVTGYGKDYKNDSYGTDVQVSFRRLKAALTARYAGGKDYEYLKSDALWKEDNEWNWSILKNERSLTTFWETKYGSRMPLGVTNVMLDVRAVNSSATYLVLSYEFSNLAQCAEIQDQVRSSGL